MDRYRPSPCQLTGEGETYYYSTGFMTGITDTGRSPGHDAEVLEGRNVACRSDGGAFPWLWQSPAPHHGSTRGASISVRASLVSRRLSRELTRRTSQVRRSQIATSCASRRSRCTFERPANASENIVMHHLR